MKKQLAVCSVLFLWGCGDGVGSDQCVGANVRCELPDDLDEVPIRLRERSTSHLPELTPTWVHKVDAQSSAYGTATIHLTSDMEGDLWFFAMQDNELVASTLDANGETTASRSFTQPADGIFKGLNVFSGRHSPGGPAVQVEWGLQRKTATETHPETLKFGERIDDPVLRVPQGYGGELWGQALVWAHDGSIYGVDEMGVVEKRDRSLNLLWRQSALNAREVGGASPSIALLDDDRIFVMVGSGTLGNLWCGLLDPSGNYERMLSSVDNDITWLLQQGSRGPVIVAGDSMGDLNVATVASNPMVYDGAKFLREDFANLGHTGSTVVDPAGNVYVVTIFGGRAPTTQHMALCRVPVEGEPTCFMLTGAPELDVSRLKPFSGAGFAVNADGIAFFLIAGSLMRFDLPN